MCVCVCVCVCVFIYIYIYTYILFCRPIDPMHVQTKQTSPVFSQVVHINKSGSVTTQESLLSLVNYFEYHTTN